jgi:hypothetical protein
MDFRLVDEIERYMAGRGLRDKYDHIVLAGASLGATTDQFTAWGTTFWDHLQIAIDLHSISSVIVIDHRDCGAFKVILGPEHASEPELEAETHARQLRMLAQMIKDKYPQLGVETYLMDLDGSVQALG